MTAVRWRLWSAQADRAVDLVRRLFHELKADDQGSTAILSLQGGLLNLRTYIQQNRGLIANFSARYREGKRIASTAAEASVSNLVSKLWTRGNRFAGQNEGQTCQFRFASPLPKAFLRIVSPTRRPFIQGGPSFHHSGRYRSFSVPDDPS